MFFAHISWCHNIITEVTSQLVSGDVGEQRWSWNSSRPASWRGRWRRSRRTGRGRVRSCRNAVSRGRLLQTVTHHNKRVKAKSRIYHKLWSERRRLHKKRKKKKNRNNWNSLKIDPVEARSITQMVCFNHIERGEIMFQTNWLRNQFVVTIV